jgi:carbamoyltransferase
LSNEEAEELKLEDPRSALRYPKSLLAHRAIGSFFAPAVGERPGVLIHLAAPNLETLGLLRALLSFGDRALGQPEVLVSGCDDPGLKETLAGLCGTQDIPLHFATSTETQGEEKRPYDFQINICGPAAGAFESSFALWPEDEATKLRDEALKDWTEGKDWHELRPWTMSQATPSDWIMTTDDRVIERKAPSSADLWLLALPEQNIWMAGLDPIPMDRLASDARKNTPHWLSGLVDAQNPYARPEGIQTYGEVSLERVSNPKGVPAIIKEKNRRLIVLGLASTTLQNHGATLLIDGQIVGAVQEERFRRRKQLGWHPPEKPHDTVVSNPRIPLERSWPKRSIEAVLEMGGITIDDVDCIAYNGVPQQYLHTYDLYDPARPPQTIADGKNMFVPHHLTHAASAYRVSGLKESVIFTVDGRGERETAAFFEVEDGRIHRLFDILCNRDSLIGGVYEYFTTILGFGHHGAGSTMGLACMGEPRFDVSNFLSANNRNSYEIHDHGISETWGHLSRSWGEPISEDHIALASSLQFALEKTVINLIADGLGARTRSNLCMAGGVALNCRMNQVLRDYFEVPNIFVQPAAHDSGTSLGAALEAHFEITGEAQPTLMEHALLGPSYSNERIAEALAQFGLPTDKRADIATEVGDLVSNGKVVCWFQDGLEFGPRALGARSILSDPRHTMTKDRMNVMKGRQWWRPLGPSILAGHEADWFDQPMHSPFMLFTLPVREDKKDQIPAVLHTDGTSRPQSVLESTHPKYHAAISQFYKNTGVPMVVNTSFNTAFEPIVNTPEDAISSFLQLGADYLAIGDYLVPQR